MGDDSRRSTRSLVEDLKNEWSLFFESFIEEPEEEKTIKEIQHQKFLDDIELEDIYDLKRVLSEQRKKINQQFETLQKEIDLNSAKLESLKIVGAEQNETMNRIHRLSDQGNQLSQKLTKLDEQTKLLRDHEELLKNQMSY